MHARLQASGAHSASSTPGNRWGSAGDARASRRAREATTATMQSQWARASGDGAAKWKAAARVKREKGHGSEGGAEGGAGAGQWAGRGWEGAWGAGAGGGAGGLWRPSRRGMMLAGEMGGECLARAWAGGRR